MEVAYVAQTESCVFLLDGDGFCRAAIPNPEADDAARKAAQRCMDAQYVASLDIDVDGILVADPKPGRQLLFAMVTPQGKVALIPTAILLEMRSLDGPMPVLAPAPVVEAIDLTTDPDDSKDAIEVKPETQPEPKGEVADAELEFALDEDRDEKKETNEHPTVEAAAPAAQKADEDECMELTAPFSREKPVLAPLVDELDDLTKDDFTKIIDRESDAEVIIKQSVVQRIVAQSLAPTDRDSSPVTVAAPRTVRGFPPPPPPIPISSRRGILPRRA